MIFFTLFACSVLEMAQTWELDRLRVLGAKSEPAEPHPGESVVLSSLVYAPQDNVEGVIWFGCLPEDATSFGCTIDPALVESFDNPPSTPEEQLQWYTTLQEAGLLGVEPNIQPTWVIPENALESLSPEAQIEGLSAFVNITALLPTDTDATAPSDIEVAYRRIPISTNPQPNQNPTIIGFVANGVEYSPEETLVLSTNQAVSLDVIFAEDAVENYQFTNRDGITEDRTEEPYCTWYTEGGKFDQEYSLYPYTEVEWTTPETTLDGKVIVVVRDRRGGMDWMTIQVKVQ